MQIKLDDFKTGWFGLQIGLTESDISALIAKLTELRVHRGHFHARSNLEGAGGIADIEFYWAEHSPPEAMTLE